MSEFDLPPPALTLPEIEGVALTHFAVSATARLLQSERDQNARLRTDTADYVLKISNAGEDPAQIALQNAVLTHLEAAGAPGIPRLLRTATGADGVLVRSGGHGHQARLVSWVAGRPLSEVPQGQRPLRALGAFMGSLSRALQGFGHPAAFRADFPWSLDHVARLRPWAADIADPARRALVEALFDRHAARIAPRLATLRASVLHQDANDNNIIVDQNDPARISGLIDFGDMCFGRTVNELAITLAYALLGEENLYAAAREVIAGYVSAFPLTEDEAGVLYDLMRMRLAASVCISSRRASAQPDNPYLLVTQAPAFELLERLDGIDPGFMTALFRRAAGFDATRAAAGVRAALAAAAPAAVFRPDVARSAQIALLSAGERSDMPAFSDRAFDGWLAAQRPATLPAAEPFYGIGPYGERRTVYATPQFADAASPERRTRHLGIDVFAPAGSPLFAPLPGRVAAIACNDAPLDYGHTLILAHETAAGQPFWTLYGHLAGTLAERLSPGQAVSAGEEIAQVGDWHENGGWAPHLHLQVMTDRLEETGGNFPGVGHDSLWDVWSDICIDPNLILGLAPESCRIDPAPPAALMARRAERLGPSLSVSYSDKLKIVRGEGAYLIDHAGRHYLDAVNNITHVGHCHPHVVAAIARQAAILNTNTRYLNDLILDLGDRITARLPGDLKVAYFVNSGTEANELALRIARTALGRKATVVLDWAYHGNSGGMVDISPYKFKRKGGYPQPDFVQVATFPDPYRGPHRGMGRDTARAYAGDIDRALAAVRARDGSAAATFIAESLSGVGGQVLYPEGYLSEVYARIRAEGGITIADEVQCGFGRVGAHFWGFELQSVVPDIVVMGKPIGNGHPLACVVTTPDLARRFANGMEYFNSFGGNPVSMAVGHAVLDVIEHEDLQARARTTGAGLLKGYRAMAARHGLIGDVRGTGLFVGVELVRDHESRAPATDEAARIVNHMRQSGILISTDGPLDNVLKIKPPMVFGPAEADLLLEATEAALDALATGQI